MDLHGDTWMGWGEDGRMGMFPVHGYDHVG